MNNPSEKRVVVFAYSEVGYIGLSALLKKGTNSSPLFPLQKQGAD